MITKAGLYRGRACGQVVLGKSAQKGTPQIEFYLAVTKGENQGDKARWTGYFGPNSKGRTIEALQLCGWQGDDLSEFKDGELHGLDTNEVEIDIEIEEYETQVENNETGETNTVVKSSPRVKWVNDPAGRVSVENAMGEAEALNFGESMKGLVLKLKAKRPTPAAASAESGTFNHGANTSAAAAGQKGW